jgi:hypothetical protein
MTSAKTFIFGCVFGSVITAVVCGGCAAAVLHSMGRSNADVTTQQQAAAAVSSAQTAIAAAAGSAGSAQQSVTGIKRSVTDSQRVIDICKGQSDDIARVIQKVATDLQALQDGDDRVTGSSGSGKHYTNNKELLK